MAGRVGIPVRVRRVSSELKDLRLRNGLKAEEVARSLGMSMSKLSRMETGQRGLEADDVSALLGLYRVPARRREELLALVRHGQDRNWWQVQDGDLPALLPDLIRFERESRFIYNYETMFIPGLLQTGEYMKALAQGSNEGLTEAEADRLVTMRMERQVLLNDRQSPALHVLIEETTLRRPVGGPGTMYRQLSHLTNSAARHHVTVQVVPVSAGAHPGLYGPFVILEFASQPSLLYLEQRGNSAFVEEPEVVAASKQAVQRLRRVALSPEDSNEFVASLASEWFAQQ